MLLFRLYLGWKHYFQLQLKPKSGFRQPVMENKGGAAERSKKGYETKKFYKQYEK